MCKLGALQTSKDQRSVLSLACMCSHRCCADLASCQLSSCLVGWPVRTCRLHNASDPLCSGDKMKRLRVSCSGHLLSQPFQYPLRPVSPALVGLLWLLSACFQPCVGWKQQSMADPGQRKEFFAVRAKGRGARYCPSAACSLIGRPWSNS